MTNGRRNRAGRGPKIFIPVINEAQPPGSKAVDLHAQALANEQSAIANLEASKQALNEAARVYNTTYGQYPVLGPVVGERTGLRPWVHRRARRNRH